MTTVACSSCKAPIVFARTATGKQMPLDAAAITLWVVENDAEGRATTRPVVGRVSHFATCPNAAQHRRGGA